MRRAGQGLGGQHQPEQGQEQRKGRAEDACLWGCSRAEQKFVHKQMTGAPDDLVLAPSWLSFSSFQDASKLYSFSHVSPRVNFLLWENSGLGQGTGAAFLPWEMNAGWSLYSLPSAWSLLAAWAVLPREQKLRAVSILISPSRLACDRKGVIYADGCINTLSPK